jgi:hypothetical protein
LWANYGNYAASWGFPISVYLRYIEERRMTHNQLGQAALDL